MKDKDEEKQPMSLDSFKEMVEVIESDEAIAKITGGSSSSCHTVISAL